MEQQFNTGKPPAGEAAGLDDGWGPWVENTHDDDGLPPNLSPSALVQVRQREGAVYPHNRTVAWWGICWNSTDKMDEDITAYRVRLTAQQHTEPATTEPDRDIDIGDGVDENAAMLARDAAGMRETAAEQPEPDPRVERCPLLVLAPLERLGATRWGV